MGSYYQVKPWWVSSSLKGEIGRQKLLTGVWAWLYGYLLFSHENDISVDHGVIVSDLTLATSSVGHQECISQWYSWWESLHEATTRFYCSERVCAESLQVEVTLRSETVTEGLVWVLCISDSGVWSLKSRERPLCVLTNTAWEEDPASCVYGWYCNHRRWHQRHC